MKHSAKTRTDRLLCERLTFSIIGVRAWTYRADFYWSLYNI